MADLCNNKNDPIKDPSIIVIVAAFAVVLKGNGNAISF